LPLLGTALDRPFLSLYFSHKPEIIPADTVFACFRLLSPGKPRQNRDSFGIRLMPHLVTRTVYALGSKTSAGALYQPLEKAGFTT